MELAWTHSDAILSEDLKYRYKLSRNWDPSTWGMLIIMLNPSTADANKDDPTIRSCMRLARAHGFGGITVLNLFAYRTPSPEVLEREGWDEGPNNDKYIAEAMAVCREHKQVPLVAWGSKAPTERVEKFLEQASGVDLMCWRVNRDGNPGHPLYAPKNAELLDWP